MIARLNQFLFGRLPETPSDIQYWRERILNTTLLVSALAGGIAYVLNIQIVIQERAYLFGVAYTLIYAWALAVALFRRIAYWLRASTLLFALFLAGLFSALQYASVGDARVWWLGTTLLTAVFFGMRAGALAGVATTLTYLGIGFLMNQFLLTAPVLDAYIDPTSAFPWVSTGATYFVVAMLGVASFGVLVNGLRAGLERTTRLTQELEAERRELQAHTQVLERRELQIRTAAEISRAISAELDPQKLLSLVVNLVKERFNLYYVGAFLVDESGQFAVLQVGTGEAGKRMVAEGHRLPIGGTSMIGWAIANKKARIALDVGEDAVRFQNPYLPSTRSELALPMISTEDRVIGALTVQSALPRAFDEDDITVLQGIADSLAIALDHAELFNRLQESLHEVETLHRQYLSRAWADMLSAEGTIQFSYENPAPASSDDNLTTLEVPLTLRGQKIGSILVETDAAQLTARNKAFVERVAAQTALALENARLALVSERTAQLNRTVADISGKVWASTGLRGVLQTALQELGQALNASEAVIQLHLPEQTEKAG